MSSATNTNMKGQYPRDCAIPYSVVKEEEKAFVAVNTSSSSSYVESESDAQRRAVGIKNSIGKTTPLVKGIITGLIKPAPSHMGLMDDDLKKLTLISFSAALDYANAFRRCTGKAPFMTTLFAKHYPNIVAFAVLDEKGMPIKLIENTKPELREDTTLLSSVIAKSIPKPPSPPLRE